MVAAANQLPTLEEFRKAHPNATAEEFLPVVIAETNRLKEINDQQAWEYKLTSEVELDEDLNPKPKTLAQLNRVARMWMDAGLVPKPYLDARNGNAIPIASVSAAFMMARQCKVPIMVFLQSTYPVNGKIGIEAKLATSMLVASGKITGRPRYVFKRDPAGVATACTCFVKDKETGEELSQEVTWDIVVANGWHLDRAGQKSKWATMPDVMFQYRSATFVSRVHYPDVLYGMHTIDEFEDEGLIGGSANGANGHSGPAKSRTLTELSEHIGASLKPANGRTKKPETKTPEKAPDSEKSQDNDPFAPNPPRQPVAPPQETKTEPPVEVSKPAAKAPAKPSAVKETTKPAEQPKQPRPNAETLQGYISTTYSDRELADFNVPKIVESLIGNKDFTRIVESIIGREHPQYAEYLKAELQVAGVEDTDIETDGDQTGPEDDVSQDTGEDSGDEGAETAAVDQDVPDFLSNPVKRPKMGLMAIDSEKVIIGKRNPEMIRRYRESDVDGKNHPHLDPAEQAYLISLADRRAYQLEHSIPPTDKLPR